jgi:hypothetical protein
MSLGLEVVSSAKVEVNHSENASRCGTDENLGNDEGAASKSTIHANIGFADGVAEQLDERNFATFLDYHINYNMHDVTDLPRQVFTGHFLSSLQSLGPSIMFSSLFDVKDKIEPTIDPSFQQHLTRFETAHWEQAEQVPAYATISHAAWFSNPANKLVRGVTMGISRSAAELQRIG